jgi:hypothetical protein
MYCLAITDPYYYVTIMGVANLNSFLLFFLPVDISSQISANLAIVIVALMPSMFVPNNDSLLFVFNLSLAVVLRWFVSGLKATATMGLLLVFFGVVLAAVTSNVQSWLQLELHLLVSNLVIVVALVLCMAAVLALLSRVAKAKWVGNLIDAAVLSILAAASVNFLVWKWGTSDCAIALDWVFTTVAVGGAVARFAVVTWNNRRLKRNALLKEMDKERKKQAKKARKQNEQEPLLIKTTRQPDDEEEEEEEMRPAP